MPPIRRILETALYVADLDAALTFYRDVIGLRVIDAGPRLAVMDAGEATVLLLFKQGATLAGLDLPGGRIPPHDGSGPIHFAFAVAAESLDAWERHLNEHGIAVESRMTWDRGGRSVYFRDPDGHSVELATPGTWPVY
ncbi:MAG TPA: VOC family protein [Vicinamibacterales bacterium]|jgi:catechol 2,3-dioxygenase-like lactoylglutathione lyase family enzyme|nr:VOC family protein [Vicinamibacterales bacterium]